MRKIILFNITLILFISTALLLQVSNASASDPDDIYWDVSISTPENGLNGTVYAATVYDNKLIVGGEFTAVGSLVVNNIASWDGSSWSALGTGMNGGVFALTVYGGNLVAGGRFNTAGEINAVLAASWDGSTWSALGTGIDLDSSALSASLTDMTVYNNNLIAAVSWCFGFESCGGTLASWDDSTWSDLGLGIHDSPTDLTVYDNKLIVAGFRLYGIYIPFMASWNGSSLSTMGSIGDIRDLTVYDSKLIAGGLYTTVAEGNIASWDGASWSALGTGVDKWINALTIYEGNLIAAGRFNTAGETAANSIASWNGFSWSALGSGMSGDVRTLTVYDSGLIVGGNINLAGGKPCAYLARWTKVACCVGSRGDLNNDGLDADILDLTFLVDYIFRGSGDSGPCDEESDLNRDGNSSDILDLTYLVDVIFRGGPVPPGC